MPKTYIYEYEIFVSEICTHTQKEIQQRDDRYYRYCGMTITSNNMKTLTNPGKIFLKPYSENEIPKQYRFLSSSHDNHLCYKGIKQLPKILF